MLRSIASIPGTGNEIRISSMHQVEQSYRFTGLSIKHVYQGVERYQLNGETILLREGEYFLVNPTVEGAVVVDSRTPVKGLCIDLDLQTLQEVAEVLKSEQTGLFNLAFDPSLFIHKTNAKGSNMEPLLQQLLDRAGHRAAFEPDESKELFLSICHTALTAQLETEQQLRRIKAVKTQTKKALMNMLLEAREFLKDPHCAKQNIPAIAKAIGLSEFHFMRLFHTTFGITPYQYSLQCRINYSKVLLLEGGPIADVAMACGFQDLSSFSRAFKQHFGMSPSEFRSSN
ncbi:MAG: AraC family transcriptional regulator [Saprospiraceae bacterium]|nr:AraC family transcriptional regulator [Saprospiraceae bacterium]